MKRLIIIHLFFIMANVVRSQGNRWEEMALPRFKPIVTSTNNYIDIDGDGDPDLIRNFIHDTLMIYWIDDDDDMTFADTEGDLDNDCLLIDRNNDGIFAGIGDLSLDWVDSDSDGMADMMVVVENSNLQITQQWDWKSNYMWIIDTEKDGTFHFVDWSRLVLQCWSHSGVSNFYEDYHSQTLFLKASLPSYRFSNLEYSWENPFLFYDYDNDGLSEMSIRLVDDCMFKPGKKIDTYPTGKINWAAFSFDLDNDNSPSNEFDFDMSISFAGSGFSYGNQVHRFNNMRGLPDADSLFYDNRWRELEQLVYADHDSAWNLAFNNKEWSSCWLVFDEDDDCERWERVEFYEPLDPFKIGMRNGGIDNNPQADASGDRGEWDMDYSGKGKLYIGFDNRIHLFGAESGYWRIDFGAQSYQGWGGLYNGIYQRDQKDPDIFPTIKYEDTTHDGFFNTVNYDLDGDTLYEQSFHLEDYNISLKNTIVYETAQMSYDSICSLYKECSIRLWGQAQKAVQVATKYHINTKWYAFFFHPGSINEKYQYGYWLQFYLFSDLYQMAESTGDEKFIKELIKAYYSQKWESLLK